MAGFTPEPDFVKDEFYDEYSLQFHPSQQFYPRPGLVVTQYHNPAMAGNQQYNYPPPPPPPPGGPPSSNYPQQHPQYGYAQSQQPQRGGPAPRGGGRGGAQGGRGDFHASGPYTGYNGPPNGQGPPQHGPPNGYGPQGGAPYIGPQAPGPGGPQGGHQSGYAGPQWQQHDHHGPQQHGPPQHHPQPQHMHQAPNAAPLSSQNYHPNYAPQGYPPQPQYGPQQPPQQFHHAPQPPTYGHNGPPNQGPPQGGPPQQYGPPQHAQPPYRGGRGGNRGGFGPSRGGHEAPLMGPPIRMGFDNQRGDQMAQAGPNGFPQQYSPQGGPAQFSQPAYQGYPPQQFGGQRPPNQYNSNPNRGRGDTNFRGRGRGEFQNFRGRDNRHNNGGQRAPSSERFHKSAGDDRKKKKKRRTNTLGLTPNGVDHESSEEELDDVDEEARLVTLLGPDTPQLPDDLSSWLAERKARFPTKARREAASEELRQRHEQGGHVSRDSDQATKKEETKLEREQRKADELRRKLEKAERKLQAMSGSKRKREDGDEGDQQEGLEDPESSESDSDDSKPEAMSSRNGASNHISQPPKAQLQRHCKYFSTGGTCGKKGKCRFVHDQEVRNQALKDKEANGGKMTLAQRLILNDTAKDDLTILKSIKYLKEKGLMSEGIDGSAPNNEEEPDFAIKSEDYGY